MCPLTKTWRIPDEATEPEVNNKYHQLGANHYTSLVRRNWLKIQAVDNPGTISQRWYPDETAQSSARTRYAQLLHFPPFPRVVYPAHRCQSHSCTAHKTLLVGKKPQTLAAVPSPWGYPCLPLLSVSWLLTQPHSLHSTSTFQRVHGQLQLASKDTQTFWPVTGNPGRSIFKFFRTKPQTQQKTRNCVTMT